MIQMQGQAVFIERRRFKHLRELVDTAAPLHKAVLRWGARQLGQENLPELDEGIRRREEGGQESDAIRRNLCVRKIYSIAGPQQKLALRWMSLKLQPDQLAEMDRMIGRTELVLTRTEPPPPKISVG